MPFDLSTAKPVTTGFDLSTAKPVIDQSQQSPSVLDQAGRQVALGGRAIAEGAMDLASIPSNALGVILNLGLDAYDKLSGGKTSFRFTQDHTKALSDALTQAGVATPQNDAEKFSSNVSRRLVGAGLTMGAGGALASGASGVTQQVGQALASNPVVQTASAVTGPTASEAAKKAGAGPMGQQIADIAGTLAPSVISAAAPELTRRAFRGGEEGRQQVEQNIKTFDEAGTTPSVGQATEGRFNRATESLLSKAPGGAGQMSSKAESQASELGANLEDKAASLAPKSSGQDTGKAIVKGISGDGGFIEKFKAKQGQLYDVLDKFIKPDTRVDISNTKEALSNLNADIPGAPNVSEFFKNAKIKGIEGAVKADTEGMSSVAANPQFADAFKTVKNIAPEDKALLQDFLVDGKLPYQAVKKLRTLVGNELSDSWAGSDVPRSKWNALYAALSKDLESASQASGPGAQAAWNRANNFTRAGMNRIDAISNVLEKNGGPEKVFQAAVSGTKEGATTLRAVMQSLPEDAQKSVTATVLRRLGTAKAGVQNDVGDLFSTETFLTNWNSMSPEAKRVLFDRFGSDFRSNMDAVAKVASNLREGSKVFRNPSGTAQASIQYGAIGSFLTSLATGHYGIAGGVAGGAGGANLAARLMTNPSFVKWLAQSTKAPQGAIPALINKLDRSPDADSKQFADLYKAQQGAADQQQQPQRP